MAWRSQEQSYHFKKKIKKSEREVDFDPDDTGTGKKRKHYLDGIGPERMPDEFFDENGDFNLSKVKGEQARQYFERVLKIPLPPGISRITNTDPRMQAAYGRRNP